MNIAQKDTFQLQDPKSGGFFNYVGGGMCALGASNDPGSYSIFYWNSGNLVCSSYVGMQSGSPAVVSLMSGNPIFFDGSGWVTSSGKRPNITFEKAPGTNNVYVKIAGAYLQMVGTVAAKTTTGKTKVAWTVVPCSSTFYLAFHAQDGLPDPDSRGDYHTVNNVRYPPLLQVRGHFTPNNGVTDIFTDDATLTRRFGDCTKSSIQQVTYPNQVATRVDPSALVPPPPSPPIVKYISFDAGKATFGIVTDSKQAAKFEWINGCLFIAGTGVLGTKGVFEAYALQFVKNYQDLSQSDPSKAVVYNSATNNPHYFDILQATKVNMIGFNVVGAQFLYEPTAIVVVDAGVAAPNFEQTVSNVTISGRKWYMGVRPTFTGGANLQVMSGIYYNQSGCTKPETGSQPFVDAMFPQLVYPVMANPTVANSTLVFQLGKALGFNKKKGLTTGDIVGAVIGSVLFVLMLILIVLGAEGKL